MTTYDIGEIEISCGSCGSDEFRITDSVADARVECAQCGAFIGTKGAVEAMQARAADDALGEIARALKKNFRL